LISMVEKTQNTLRASAVGLAVTAGAALGLIIGLLAGGGEWIVRGLAIGAALGVVVGAVYAAARSKS